MTRFSVVFLLALAAAGAAGCTWVPEKKPAPPLDLSLDPCPSRLHDIAGSLLLYYVAHENLPPDTVAIQQAGQVCPPLECPLTHRPYVYNPYGVEISGVIGLVVMYDDAPVHDGRRWGLIVSQISPAAPLKVDVIRLPAGFNPPPPVLPPVPLTPPVGRAR